MKSSTSELGLNVDCESQFNTNHKNILRAFHIDCDKASS